MPAPVKQLPVQNIIVLIPLSNTFKLMGVIDF